jgi:hypothetical protein
MLAAVLEWTMDRFQDALLAGELFPGFLRRRPKDAARSKKRIRQFLAVLQGGLAARKKAR